MARYEFRLPDIGEGIAEAEIVAWHVKVGDEIQEDQQFADVMTDKATVEMESPVSGRVLELGGKAGEQIAVGSILIVLETANAETAPTKGRKPESKAEPAAARADPAPKKPKEDRKRPLPEAKPAVTARPVTVLASPAVRRRARDLGVDLSRVRTASGDRIRHADLDAYLLYHGGSVASAPAPRSDETIKVAGLRRRIAQNMQEAKQRIPHFSYVEELDVTALEATRRMLNDDPGENPRLTLLPFLITAVCRALASFPQINARYDDDAEELTRYGAVHMGVATQTDAGLMVPVIRDAQACDVWRLAAEIRRLSEAARSGSAKREELSGSTITLSSLGPLGGIVSTPVINRPEVAIIAVNRIVEKPVAVDGRVEIRKTMNLSSSFDHRIVDGWEAAGFIQEVKRLIEHPLLLLSLR
jgi:2-oxoisovalerate dehydrogenase E2 component (dihydrolipoyl transacylase)